MAEDTAEAPAAGRSGAPKGDARADAIGALIRNGLSNGPIAQQGATWDHLNTRLGEIVAAILKEL